MAYRYTNNEYADMYLIYGEANCVSARAAALYAERYSNRVHPDRKVFERLDRRIREDETLLLTKPRVNAGRNRHVRLVEMEEEVLEMIQQDPTTSTRRVAREFGVSHNLIHKIWKEENLYPYHYNTVQELNEQDYGARVNFCRWLLRNNEADENFLANIMWTDESLFTRMGMYNCHNSHYYDIINPRVTRTRSFQRRWKLNVWAGILGDRIIGPSLLPDRLTGENYADFIENLLPEFLEDVPLMERNAMYFQQDGAPPHGYRRVTRYLNEHYPGRWIAQYGPIRWPARSPDLTPLDFFLWGHLKETVYSTPPASPEDAIARIMVAVEDIDGAMLRRTRENIILRAEACIEAGGAHFEQLLN